ncbi:hypothetical protein [Sorangium sp. So ce693]|uniref:hypothetical protein n=1 Tax=Sorangium sp. So ce693 TaxID=3133318 RepID=UPI003F5FEF9F
MALAIDGEANVVLAGRTRGAADFGAGATPLVGSADIFVATYANDGALRWARRFGGGSEVMATGVAVDGNDGIAVIGHYANGPLQAGDLVLEELERDDPRTSSSDIFVLALDRDGAPRWMRRLGGGDFDYGGRVAVGPGNDVVVAAQAGGRLTLARFTADGTARFATDVGKLSGSITYAISGMAVDLRGDILVAGTFSDDADLGGGSTTGLRGAQAWVAKYSGEDGVHLWSRHFGAPEDSSEISGDVAKAMIVDEHGDVLIAGQFARGADLGEGRIDRIWGNFLMKLAGEDGATRWVNAFPGAQYYGSTSLSFAPDGRVALIISLAPPFDRFDLGGGSVDTRGTYIATYEPGTGAFVAQRRIVELGTDIGNISLAASALDAKGHLSFVTSFSYSVPTGFGVLKSEGWGTDVLLAHVPL